MSPAWIGLGANLGRPRHSLEQALTALETLPSTRLVAVSPAYWTPPWGEPDQPEFLNAVACLATGLDAFELLQALLAIETALGRRRDRRRWGPREIDLDLLLYADLVVETEPLSLPHPRLHERAFVLVPLADLAPDLGIPGRGRVRDLLEALPDEELSALRPEADWSATVAGPRRA